LEQDPWLYTLHCGNYVQHCLISDYVAKPAVALVPASKLAVIGTAEYGFNPTSYALAKLDPKLAGLLPPQYAPSPIDVASLLPPATTTSPARIEAASKAQSSAAEALSAIALGEQQRERENDASRHRLGEIVAKAQAFERAMGKFAEMTAVSDRTATFGSTGPQIAVGDQQLAQLIGTSCFQCHGGAKSEAGLDFKQAASFDDDQWSTIVAYVQAGLMPKGGQPLGKDQVALFKAEYKRSLSRAAR
jgi:hypothetical protein